MRSILKDIKSTSLYNVKGNPVLYVKMLKALYGMIISSMLFYKKFVSDITPLDFELNPYDPCVANRIINGKQHMITWHVDDVKSSHVESKVNDEFEIWLQETYAADGIRKVKANRTKKHEYLGMVLDYTVPGALMIDMRTYLKT